MVVGGAQKVLKSATLPLPSGAARTRTQPVWRSHEAERRLRGPPTPLKCSDAAHGSRAWFCVAWKDNDGGPFMRRCPPCEHCTAPVQISRLPPSAASHGALGEQRERAAAGGAAVGAACSASARFALQQHAAGVPLPGAQRAPGAAFSGPSGCGRHHLEERPCCTAAALAGGGVWEGEGAAAAPSVSVRARHAADRSWWRKTRQGCLMQRW